MDRFARNALRLTLAGAGLVVLGAGYVDQASAAEFPDTTPTQGSPAEHSGPGTQDPLPATATPGAFALPTVADIGVPGT